MATFHSIVAKGLHSVKDANLVTFGVKPTHPETGYGYLEAKNVSGTELTRVTKFVEKLCESVAKILLNRAITFGTLGYFFLGLMIWLHPLRLIAQKLLRQLLMW